MTPYELRFEIFKQAQNLADQEFHTRFSYVDRKRELDPNYNEDYPQYPSFYDIRHRANQINDFVSSN